MLHGAHIGQVREGTGAKLVLIFSRNKRESKIAWGLWKSELKRISALKNGIKLASWLYLKWNQVLGVHYDSDIKDPVKNKTASNKNGRRIPGNPAP